VLLVNSKTNMKKNRDKILKHDFPEKNCDMISFAILPTHNVVCTSSPYLLLYSELIQ